jgi:hypothetical protein
LRLNVIVLLRLSPNVDRICEVGEKVAVMAIVVPRCCGAMALLCAARTANVVGVRRRASTTVGRGVSNRECRGGS